MGEGQSKQNSGLFNTSNPLIQRYLAPKPQVNPYREGMPAPKESILQVFLNQNPSQNRRSNLPHLTRTETKIPPPGRFQESAQETVSPRRDSNYANEDYQPTYDQSLRKAQTRYGIMDSTIPTMGQLDDRDKVRKGSMKDVQTDKIKEGEMSSYKYKDSQTRGFDRQYEEGKWEKNNGGRFKSRMDEDAGFEYRFKCEERFNPAEVEILRENFENYAKENRINKYGLLKLLSLEEFEDSIIGSRIYSCIKQISSRGATFGNYVNYERYVQAMGILSRGEVQERLKFIYHIFDPNGEDRVMIQEMKNVLESLFRILHSTKFEHPTLNLLNEKISELDEEEIESLLEEISKEIFINYGKNSSYLTYEEWESWFMTQYGMFDVLNFKIKRLDV